MVAYNDLKSRDPKALQKAEDILAPLTEFFLESDYPFVEAAEWPDDIKGQNWKSFNILHFLNYPVIDPDFKGDIKTSVDNATFAYNECTKVLSLKSSDYTTMGKSMCMRFMIHIIGDVHQPLHTAAYFSQQFPDGDLGGNKFMINYPAKKYANLHAYWDDTAHNYSSSIKAVSLCLLI